LATHTSNYAFQFCEKSENLNEKQNADDGGIVTGIAAVVVIDKFK